MSHAGLILALRSLRALEVEEECISLTTKLAKHGTQIFSPFSRTLCRDQAMKPVETNRRSPKNGTV